MRAVSATQLLYMRPKFSSRKSCGGSCLVFKIRQSDGRLGQQTDVDNRCISAPQRVWAINNVRLFAAAWQRSFTNYQNHDAAAAGIHILLDILYKRSSQHRW